MVSKGSLRCSGMVDGWNLGTLGDLWQRQVESGGIPRDVPYSTGYLDVGIGSPHIGNGP